EREVAGQADDGDRHARELGVLGLLDGLAAVVDGAHGRAAGVVDDGQVGGDADAEQRERHGDRRPPAHAESCCSLAGRSVYSICVGVWPERPTKTDGVEFRPSDCASCRLCVSWSLTALLLRCFMTSSTFWPAALAILRR